MNLGYTSRIQQRVQDSVDGTIFISSDFTDIADTETVRRTLNRMAQTGVLHRVLNGVYEKPRYSQFLGEYIAVDPDSVAEALARNYHWTIAPCGNTALNLLGLSTQVSASWSYISDGPYRTYEWDGAKLEFRHRTNREISGMSPTTRLVVQALKAIGKANITSVVIAHISRKLSDAEKAALLIEAGESTDWVYNTIRQICREVPAA